MNAPSFSVVLATYNRGEHIRPTIESVLRQAWRDFELIVVGDGCDDATEGVVRSFADARVSWYGLTDNSGSQSAPNNAGIACARGDWVGYIGHDDVWAPDHLQRLRGTIDTDSALDFAVSGCIFYGPEGSGFHHVTGMFDARDAEETALQHFFPPSSLAHRRNVTDRIGPWRDPQTLQAPVDADFLLRAAAAGLRFGSTGQVTVHKFAAGHRYLSYLRPSSAEQSAMLRSLERSDGGWVARLVEDAKRTGQFMQRLHQDFSKFENGELARRNRLNKGLQRTPLRPLLSRTVIAPADDPRALDWYRMERDRNYRWSGPNPRPKIMIPYTGGGANIAIEVVAMLPETDLGAVAVFVEDREVDCAVEAGAGGGWLRFRAPLKPSDCTVLELHTPAMARPAELLGRRNNRKVGIAVGDIVLEPL
jgi:glycosyltransferase involved in cell wall biosynthesis